MKNRLLPLVFAFLAVTSVSAQQCGTHEGSFEEQQQKYPDFYQGIESQNTYLNKANKSALSKIGSLKVENGKKIIPVVVHVIHELGNENVSDAQVQAAIDALNRNINGQSDKFLGVTGGNLLTPDVFAAVRGVADVEFRLAKIDPKGSATSGINRVESAYTNGVTPRDLVKTVSYWNAYQYFNIWVVKNFSPQADGGTLLGYAQFPFTNSLSTDGIVLLSSEFDDVESTTLSHEVGHWLGLRHTWGDANCGDDGVKDTPPQRSSNGFGSVFTPLPNPSLFPYHINFPEACVADSLNPAGEMYMNYMDYTNDNYVTMFTKGQVGVMYETLEGVFDEENQTSGIGFREYLCSAENIIATGTAEGYVAPTCTKEADFDEYYPHYSVCLGSTNKFRGNQNLFSGATLSWDFGDGNTSSANTPNHVYGTAGSYDVTVTIEYEETTTATASQLSDLDIALASSYDSVTTNVMVQGTEAELLAMNAGGIVEITLDTIGLYFDLVDTSYFRGFVEQVQYIAYYMNSCVSTKVKEKFITVTPSSSSNNASSYTYGFESENDLGNDWIASKSENNSEWNFNATENISWEWVAGVSENGNGASLMMAEEKLTIGTDALVSVAYDLSAFTTPAIKFYWSGAGSNTTLVNEFNVFYSTDCGWSWKALGSLTNSEVANAGFYNYGFKPNADEWADTIMSKTQLKNNNVRFKFEYVTNGNANNFYLDNIQIGEAANLMLPNSTIASRLSIYPNPTAGKTSIELNNLADKEVEVKLVNILGAEIMHLFSGEIESNYYMINNIDLSHLETGIYFVKVVADGDIIKTDKLILK